MEAVEADQLARMVDLDVARLEWRRPLRLGRRSIAGHERQAADAPILAVPAEHAHTPLALTAMAPQRAWARLAATRRGP